MVKVQLKDVVLRKYRFTDQTSVWRIYEKIRTEHRKTMYINALKSWKTQLVCMILLTLGTAISKTMLVGYALGLAYLGLVIYSCYRLHVFLCSVDNDLARINLDYMKQGGHFLIATYHKQIIGFVGLSSNVDSDDEGVFELRQLCVDKEYRRQGVGEKLLYTIIEHANSLPNCTKLEFTIEPNVSPLGIFTKFGFQHKLNIWFGYHVHGLATMKYQRYQMKME
ncbi:unnamed protein product [Owenia fusiformis]|nr:unnamed protein product [Owenia fusiformis]